MGSRVPLQAVILADSFTTKLGPITLECPKVLLPLVNTPMIDYTLAWLESADVEQVFVMCSSHSRKIIDYLDKSKWVNKPKFSVTTIESHNCMTAGDALRLIHKRNVIRGDFILVNGDTVSNMMLTQALQEHKENNAIMTMVIKQSEQPQVTTDKLIMAIDPTTKQLLHYEDKTDDIKFNKSYLTVNPCLSLHNDKQDCYIDICSPQVLGLFTDKFNYQHLRHDFVNGLLADEDLKIFTHEIHSSCYAARIDNFGSYASTSKDIIQRRTYPFVPDDLFLITKSEIHGACNITQESQVGPFTYIGKDTIIGDKTVISNSVVGDGCKIGSNVVIDGCYIWSNVTIEDGCKLRDAILCDGVVMKSGAVLKPGVVLSYKVVVGQKFVVPSCSKVSLLEIGDSMKDYVVSDMGEDERGFVWSMSEVDHEEEWRHIESDEEIFEKRVEEIFLRAVRGEAIGSDILHNVESVWMCSNMGLEKCACVLFYLMMRLALDNSNNSGNDLVKETHDVISKWGGLMKQFSRGVDEQIQVILKFEEMCLKESMKDYAPLFVQVLYILYCENKIEEEAILKWANEKDESDKVFVKQSEKFIQWLKEASEEKYREFQETNLKRLSEGGVQVKKNRPTQTDLKRFMNDRRAQAKKSRSMKTDLKRLNEVGVLVKNYLSIS